THPGWIVGSTDPDGLLHGRLILGLEVIRAVLEAHQVARCLLSAAGARRAAEAKLRPAHHHQAARQPCQVAHGVERDLWIFGTRLHAEVAAAALRLEYVA